MFACTNDYLRCTKCEVHDRVHKHVIRCTKKLAPRFLILEDLFLIHFRLYTSANTSTNFQFFGNLFETHSSGKKKGRVNIDGEYWRKTIHMDMKWWMV